MTEEDILDINDVLVYVTDELLEKGYLSPEQRRVQTTNSSVTYMFEENEALGKILEEEVTQRLKSMEFQTTIQNVSGSIYLNVRSQKRR